MRIIQANKFYFLKGGAERYFFELTRQLVGRGHQVVPFAMKYPRNEPTQFRKYFVSTVSTEEQYGWQGLRTAGRVLYSFEAAGKFSALAKETEPDILHAHNIYHQLSPSILAAASRLGIPSVMTLHDYHLVSPNYLMFDRGRIVELSKKHPYWDTFKRRTIGGSFASSALSAFEGWLHKKLKLYDSVRTFIAPSRFLKNKCVEYGIAPGRIEVIPHFIDLSGRETVSSSERSVLFVGRLSEEKGAMTLIEAMRDLPDIRCVIVGEGPQRTRLHKTADDLKLRNVEFTGALYGDELKAEYERARVVIIPSVCYENAPMVALEAYAWGKPVAASNIGGLPEVVRNGETGLLFEPGNSRDLADKISRLMDEDRAARMGAAGRALAEREYDPETHLEKILGVYERATSK